MLKIPDQGYPKVIRYTETSQMRLIFGPEHRKPGRQCTRANNYIKSKPLSRFESMRCKRTLQYVFSSSLHWRTFSNIYL